MSNTTKNWADKHIWEFPAVRDCFWIGLGLTLLWIGYELRTIFTPVLLGFAIAYMVNPIVSFAEQSHKIPRPVTVSAILLLFAGVLIGIATLFGPVMVSQSMQLIEKLPLYLSNFAFLGVNGDDLQKHLSDMVAHAQKNPSALVQPVLTRVGALFGFASGILNTTSYVLTSLLLIPVCFFFFSWRYDPMLLQARNYIPDPTRASVLNLVGKFDKVFGSFVRGRIVIGLIQSVLFCIGYWLIDMPYWFLVGLFSGLLCILPLVGFLGWPLAVLLKYMDVTTGTGNAQMDVLSIFLWPSIIYGIIQAIESVVLTPTIQGLEMKMNPVTILIVILIGGAMGGLYGVLLAIPLAACARIIFDEVLQPRLKKWATDTE